MVEPTSSGLFALLSTSVLLGVFSGHVLILSTELSEYPTDYILAGLKRLWLFAGAVVLAESLLGILLLQTVLQPLLVRQFPEGVVQHFLLPISAGILSVAVPRSIEALISAFLPIDKLDKTFARWGFSL